MARKPTRTLWGWTLSTNSSPILVTFRGTWSLAFQPDKLLFLILFDSADSVKNGLMGSNQPLPRYLNILSGVVLVTQVEINITQVQIKVRRLKIQHK